MYVLQYGCITITLNTGHNNLPVARNKFYRKKLHCTINTRKLFKTFTFQDLQCPNLIYIDYNSSHFWEFKNNLISMVTSLEFATYN